MLSTMQKKVYGWFGLFASRHVSDKFKKSLASAHITMKAEVYMAQAFLYSIIGFFVIASMLFLFSALFFPLLEMSFTPSIFLNILALSLLGSLATYVVYMKLPKFTAKGRAKKIDANLSYALNFISAMSSAGVTPTEIFKSLSQQSIYGEVQKEAAWIYRDTTLLGKDIVSSIRENIHRTPSERFREFLQGLIVTVTSGGSLKSYFSAKAQQFMVENRQQQKQLIETLGIMAESYVTAAVAGILLLFIVIPLMMIISGDVSGMFFLYLLVFLIVPLIHLSFAMLIYIMFSEA